jgi:ligand-binding sensor domain-containing protein
MIAGLLLLALPLGAQRVGEWQMYLATHDTRGVTEAASRVYAVANGTLYSYGKDDNSVTVHSKLNGLSDAEVSLTDYHPGTKTLLIVYSNGNIDLMSEEGVQNLPFLKNATNIADKTVNSIYLDGDNAYLSAAFGIMVIRMSKKEIAETYRLNVNTYSTCIRGGTIYAATAEGMRRAAVGDNLLDIRNWQSMPLQSADFREKDIRRLCAFQDAVCFLADSAGVFYLDANGGINTLLKHNALRDMTLQSGRLIIHSASTLYVCESLSHYESAGVGVVYGVSSLKDDGNYWIAAGENGLVGIRRTAAGQFEPFVSGLNAEGPKRNLTAFLTMHGRRLLVAGGGRWTDRFWNPGTLMAYENGKWTNLDENAINRQAGYGCFDYTGVAADPNDDGHYFISTYGEGVLEVKDGELVQLYNHANSPLQSILPNNRSYIRVGSVCFDRSGNLWMTNCQVDRGIVVRTADGKWSALQYQGINSSSYLVDRILITSKGHKWVNVPRSSERTGILVFDDRGTPGDASDDVANFFPSFKSGTGAAIESGVYYCMEEDLNGEIWIGTDIGPIYCPSPGRAVENPDNLYCNRIVRTDANGENYYFLNGEQVNAIAVDGGNRKWLGTAGSGVFLVSADGMETIHQFATDNSPLYSNNIQSIAIDQQTGEVFIGTDKGLISYRGEATKASESYSDVYAFPNPVRPDFDGSVVVTGLMHNSNVKITDLNGNLIFQGRSAGGQLAWNCRGSNGRPVATGIYLVLSSTPGAKESVVTKIAVVK